MTDSYIGQWLARNRKGSKLHLVESEITDRLVMRCGRQMPLVRHGLGLYALDRERCAQCAGRIVAD